MINIQIDEQEALEMLMNRVKYWRDNAITLELFEKMYENYVFNGFFEGTNFDVDSIVDNDVVNWCSEINEGDQDFEELLKLYDEGEYDVSCEHLSCGASFIEAVSDDRTAILIRQ